MSDSLNSQCCKFFGLLIRTGRVYHSNNQEEFFNIPIPIPYPMSIPPLPAIPFLIALLFSFPIPFTSFRPFPPFPCSFSPPLPFFPAPSILPYPIVLRYHSRSPPLLFPLPSSPLTSLLSRFPHLLLLLFPLPIPFSPAPYLVPRTLPSVLSPFLLSPSSFFPYPPKFPLSGAPT